MFSPLVKFKLQRDVKWGLLRSVRSEMFIVLATLTSGAFGEKQYSEL